jgi:hypothetical protein
MKTADSTPETPSKSDANDAEILGATSLTMEPVATTDPGAPIHQHSNSDPLCLISVQRIRLNILKMHGSTTTFSQGLVDGGYRQGLGINCQGNSGSDFGG